MTGRAMRTSGWNKSNAGYGQAGFAVPKSLRAATPSRIARALARMLVPTGAACRRILSFQDGC